MTARESEAVDGTVLSTERLVMRPLTVAYLSDMLALYSEPEVIRFLKPLDEAGHLRRLRENEEMWAFRGYGRGRHPRSGNGPIPRPRGPASLALVRRGRGRLGASAEAWGKGWATEAGRAWTTWALEHLDVPYVTACISPDNHPSRGVAERLGMQVIREDVLHDREVLVFALRRSRWSS